MAVSPSKRVSARIGITPTLNVGGLILRGRWNLLDYVEHTATGIAHAEVSLAPRLIERAQPLALFANRLKPECGFSVPSLVPTKALFNKLAFDKAVEMTWPFHYTAWAFRKESAECPGSSGGRAQP